MHKRAIPPLIGKYKLVLTFFLIVLLELILDYTMLYYIYKISMLHLSYFFVKIKYKGWPICRDEQLEPLFSVVISRTLK